jgi:hypothetical protein
MDRSHTNLESRCAAFELFLKGKCKGTRGAVQRTTIDDSASLSPLA